MKHFTIAVLIFQIVGCAPKSPMPFAESNPIFAPYVEYFVSLTGLPTYVPINFDDVGPYAGACHTYGIYKWVSINWAYWETATETEKLTLILHELGHCELNKPHNNIMLDFECPSSIMNEYIVTDYCFNKYEQHYLKEFTE